MDAHELVTPNSTSEWDTYHAIRREVLWEARGLFGIYNENHPDETAPNNHPKLLVYEGEPVGVVRIDFDAAVAALRRALPAKIAETLSVPAISVEGGEVSGQ